MAEFKVNSKRFKRDLKKVKRYLNTRFPSQVLGDFKANTPIDSGNARRKTKLRSHTKGHQIIADYPYSRVLDEGEFPNPPAKGTGKTRDGYSTQAPKGMVEPTLEQAEKRFNRFIRRL